MKLAEVLREFENEGVGLPVAEKDVVLVLVPDPEQLQVWDTLVNEVEHEDDTVEELEGVDVADAVSLCVWEKLPEPVLLQEQEREGESEDVPEQLNVCVREPDRLRLRLGVCDLVSENVPVEEWEQVAESVRLNEELHVVVPVALDVSLRLEEGLCEMLRLRERERLQDVEAELVVVGDKDTEADMVSDELADGEHVALSDSLLDSDPEKLLVCVVLKLTVSVPLDVKELVPLDEPEWLPDRLSDPVLEGVRLHVTVKDFVPEEDAESEVDMVRLRELLAVNVWLSDRVAVTLHELDPVPVQVMETVRLVVTLLVSDGLAERLPVKLPEAL